MDETVKELLFLLELMQTVEERLVAVDARLKSEYGLDAASIILGVGYAQQADR